MLLVIKVSNLPNSDLYRSNGPTLERQIQDLKSSRAELMKSAAAVREREREKGKGSIQKHQYRNI